MPELIHQRHTQSVLLRAFRLARRGIRSIPLPRSALDSPIGFYGGVFMSSIGPMPRRL